MADTETNRAALKRFYEKKDPARVKNVDPMFLRFEEHDILYFVEQKYHEQVEGWMGNPSASEGENASSPASANVRSSGFFSANSLLRRSFKNTKKPTLVQQQQNNPLKGSNAANAQSLANIVISNTNSDSEEDEEEGDEKKEVRSHPATPAVTAASAPAVSEVVVVEELPASSPRTTPSLPRMTPEEVNAKIAEIARKEKEALDLARAEEAKIKERQMKAKEAIAKAMRELEEKEKELEEVKRQMELEKKRGADVKERRKTMNVLSMQLNGGGNGMLTQQQQEMLAAHAEEEESDDNDGEKETTNPIKHKISFNTPHEIAKEEEALQKEEADLKRKNEELALAAKRAEDQKQAVIQKVQEAESEALLLMVQENEILRTEVAISNRLQKVDELNAPIEEEEEQVQVEEEKEDEPVLAAPVESKRMTRYERKIQEALVAEPAKPKSVMGSLLGRMTVTGKKKVEQPQQLAPMVEEEPTVATAEDSDVPRPVSLAPSPATSTPSLPQPGTQEYAEFIEFQRFQQQQFQAFQNQKNRPVSIPAPAPSAPAPVAVVVEPPIVASIKFIPEALKGQVDELMDENERLKRELAEAKLMAENAKLKRELEDAKRVAAAAAAPPPPPQIVYVQQSAPVYVQQQASAAPAPAATTPAPAAAATASVGEPYDDGSGFKRYPAGHADLDKYKRMQKTGLPQGPIENAMMRDFIHPASIYGDNALNNPKPKPGAAKPPPAAGAAPAASAGGGGAEPYDDGSGFKRYPIGHPDLEKYKRMQKTGLPQGPIENAMMRDFVHPASIYGDNALNNPKPKPGGAKPIVAAAKPAASAGGDAGAPGEFRRLAMDHADMEKYKRMQKTGLPQGPIENAMMRDFVHPASLYGANAINDPKPKPMLKPAAAKPAPVAAAAAPAVAAPANGKPPPGMSMMEEMKWRQAQKAKEGPKAPVVVKPVEKPVEAKPAAMKLGDKPPPGMSMMEEMKWKQAQKKLKEEEDAKNGIAPKVPVVGGGGFQKPAPAPAPAPSFKIGLKSTGNSSFLPNKPAAPATPSWQKPTASATPSWQKPPTKAVIQTATNLAAAAPAANVEALVNLFIGAKISMDNARKYANALAQEGFDAPEKLAMVDDADLAACGITARFDIKIINSLKTVVPKVAPAPAAAPAATAPKPAYQSSFNKGGPTLPTYGQNQPIKPNFVINKPAVAAPAPAPAPTSGRNFVINKPAAAAPAPAPAAIKPNFVINKAPGGAGGFNKPAVGGASPGFGAKPALKSSADAQKEKDAARLAFVMSLGAPLDSYKKPKQIG